MKQQKLLTLFLSFFLILSVTSAYSDSAIPEDMSFLSAMELSFDQLKKSPYKSLEVQTVSGSFSGDFDSKSKDVLVLRTKTHSVHMKSGKEKVILTYIDVSKITAISVNVLSD